MRKILFKAKRLDNGEWVEGYYQKRKDAFENDEHLIFRCESYHTWEYVEVDPETLCQYTGLNDRNRNKIWENDIVEVFGEDRDFKIEWQEDTAQFVMVSDDLIVTYDNYWSYETLVTGNIFNNPETLERMGEDV